MQQKRCSQAVTEVRTGKGLRRRKYVGRTFKNNNLAQCQHGTGASALTYLRLHERSHVQME
jgi:hypothetical protein